VIGVSLLFSFIPLWLGTKAVKKQPLFLSSWTSHFLRKIRGRFALNIAFSSIINHKMRSIISILGLTVLISLFIIIQSTGTSIRTTLHEEIYDIRTYDFYVLFDSPISQTEEMTDFIESIEDIASFEYWYIREGILGDDSVQICGIPRHTRIYHPVIIEGSSFTPESEGILLSRYLAESTGTTPGETITVNIEANTFTLDIRGIVADADHDGKTLFVPIDMLRDMVHGEGKITHIMIDLIPTVEEKSEEVGILVKEGLLDMNIHGTIRTKAQSMQKTENLTSMFLLLFYSFFIFVCVIVFINTAYTLTITVITRKNEFSLLETLGANKPFIFIIILTTSISLALPAWIISIFCSPSLSEAFVTFVSNTMLPITFTFSESSLLVGLIMALGVSVLAALYSMIHT
jgi:ABC-type lipoprotein release transport system permease subunit